MLRFSSCNLSNITARALSSIRTYATELAATDLDADSVISDENSQEREKEIEKMRNKSRLSSAHFNHIRGLKPYEEPRNWVHHTARYNRKLLGTYGFDSKVDPAICWMDQNELSEKIEHDQLRENYTLQEMFEKAQLKRFEAVETIRKREQDIETKVLKLDQWKADLNMKIEKKKTDAEKAKAKKDRLVEEVRRHFGFKVDPRDERFQEMLAQREKEQKKADKLAKKAQKEAQMIAKLQQKNAEVS